MSDDTWLTLVPEIPLTRGVPAILVSVEVGDWQGLHARVVVMDAWSSLSLDRVRVADADGDQWMKRPLGLRVDLEDPQGFAYALRFLAQLIAEERRRDRFVEWDTSKAREVWLRHMNGETTPRDVCDVAASLRLIAAPRVQRRHHEDGTWCLYGDACGRDHPLRDETQPLLDGRMVHS